MIENENKIDLLFRQKVEGINLLPEEINWDKLKGWERFEKNYFDNKKGRKDNCRGKNKCA